MTPEELPAYSDLILPTVRAVMKLGGSATAREVTSQVLADLAPTDALLTVSQPNRPESSVLMERIQWARSYAKPIGALESPRRAVISGDPARQGVGQHARGGRAAADPRTRSRVSP